MFWKATPLIFSFSPLRKALEALALPVIPGPVHLEVLKEEEELFEMVHGKPVVDAVKGMGQDVEDPLSLQIRRQVVDVLPEFLDLLVVGFVDVVDLLRFRKALRAPQFERPLGGSFGEFGMDVQIDFNRGKGDGMFHWSGSVLFSIGRHGVLHGASFNIKGRIGGLWME